MTRFTVYFNVRGTHTHARLFVNGALSGELVLTNEEFQVFRTLLEPEFEFKETW